MNKLKLMMKTLCGVALGAAVMVMTPDIAHAGYQCTYDSINEGKALKAQYEVELAQAKVNKAQADAAVTQLRAQGASQLELLVATDHATNCEHLVRAALDRVNNAQKYIENATNRLYWEDQYMNVMGLWKNQANLDLARQSRDGAKEAYNNAAAAVELTKNCIASQTLLSSANPQMMDMVNQLNAVLAVQEAEAAAKLQVYLEKDAEVKAMEQSMARKWDAGDYEYYEKMVFGVK